MFQFCNLAATDYFLMYYYFMYEWPVIIQKLFFPSRCLLTFKKYSRAPFIRTLVIRIANYPDRLGRSDKSVENPKKKKKKKNPTFLEITGYRIKYSTVLWLLELQIWRGRKVHTVNSNSRTSNCQFNLFSEKNPIIRIFCISGWLDVPINPDKCSFTAQVSHFLLHYAGSIFLYKLSLYFSVSIFPV